MGTKVAIAFANQIFMGKVETEILSQSAFKPLVWKRHIDDIFSLWDTNREVLTEFIDQANNDHPTIKFTAEISDTETTFLDTSVYKGQRFIYESVLDIHTHYKPTETCPYTFSSCHPPGVKKSFIKGEALRLLITNSSKTAFEGKIKHFQSYLAERGYQEGLVQRTLSKIESRPFNQDLKQTKKFGFCNAIQRSSTNLFKTNTNETLVFNRKTTTSQRNIIQRTSSHSTQKR